jgi:hypothetical protein
MPSLAKLKYATRFPMTDRKEEIAEKYAKELAKRKQNESILRAAISEAWAAGAAEALRNYAEVLRARAQEAVGNVDVVDVVMALCAAAADLERLAKEADPPGQRRRHREAD